MTRKLVYLSTLFFWFALAIFWAGQSMRPLSNGDALDPAERSILTAELAGHDQPRDCWMAIRGNVYDVTTYLPEHPSPAEIIMSWCGKEATAAYETKTRGRPHSAHADGLLPTYRIGQFDNSQ